MKAVASMATKSFAVGMPPDPKSLVAQLKTLDKSSFKDSSEKTRFLDELKQVVNSLSQPSDLAFDHVFGNGACVAAISTLVEAGAFTKWEEEGADALSCTELSDLIGIDVVLLSTSAIRTRQDRTRTGLPQPALM